MSEGRYSRMNKRIAGKLLNCYQQLAEAAGLRLNEEEGTMYGTYGGYQMLVHPFVSGSRAYFYMLTVEIAAQARDSSLTKQDCKIYKKEHRNVSSLAQNQNLITMTLKSTSNQEKLRAVFLEELQNLTSYLRLKGYENCCQLCGKTGEDTSPCTISGFYAQLCSDCFQNVSQSAILAQQESRAAGENVIGGIVGALLGTLIGVVCIIILSQLGYVAALSGVVMAVCTLKGYEMLGRKLSKKGIIISCILMIVMTYAGDRLDWAIVVARELAWDVFTSYQAIPWLLQEFIIGNGLCISSSWSRAHYYQHFKKQKNPGDNHPDRLKNTRPSVLFPKQTACPHIRLIQSFNISSTGQ